MSWQNTLADVCYAALRPAEGPPPKVARWLAQYGNLPIQGLTVCRQPINSILEAILRNALPPFSVPYDKLYHLWIHVHLGEANNPTKWKHFNFEKNEVVRVEEVPAFDPHACPDHLTVPIPPTDPPLTLNALFANARHRHPDARLWVYDPVYQNCQRFVWALLSSSGLGSPQLEEFIVQDVRRVLKGPWYLAAKGVVDLASFFRRLTGGERKMLRGGYLRGGDEVDDTLRALGIEPEAPARRLPPPPPSPAQLQAEQEMQLRRELAAINAAENAAEQQHISNRRAAQDLKRALQPPVSEEDELLAMGFNDIGDLLGDVNSMFEGRGMGGCVRCGGPKCAGIVGGCLCHGDKYGLGGYCPPNAYLAGSNKEVGAGFWDVLKSIGHALVPGSIPGPAGDKVVQVGERLVKTALPYGRKYLPGPTALVEGITKAGYDIAGQKYPYGAGRHRRRRRCYVRTRM